MMSLLFILFYASLQWLCTAQENVGSGIDCIGDTTNCHKNFSCIDNYHDLELYIKGNKEIIENLKSAFFHTGEAPSNFVQLVYNFKISRSDNSNGSFEFPDDCSNHTSKYIWSDSPLYLLGPRTLVWFTFFIVNIPEIRTTIDLPCLCHDKYNSLLSRLTYMVRIRKLCT